MNEKERFQAICRGQQVDYIPLIGLPGASGLSFGGAWGQIYQRLLDTGMPKHVKGWNYQTQWDPIAAQSWSDYWGTLTPLTIDFWPCDPCPGIQSKKTYRDGYEIIEYNTGAITRQILDGDNAYSMPEFAVYHVRDRASWEFYRDVNTPGQLWPSEIIDQVCSPYDHRDIPLFISLLSTWGAIRDLMGPETACTLLYDDPELAHDIIQWQANLRRKYLFPLVERLKPEILKIGEDCCYNHGMMIAPQHFLDFCGDSYREIVQLAHHLDCDCLVVDTDGNVMEFVPLLHQLGVNGIYPVEAKSNNDLMLLRQQFPDFIFFGWVEKEVVNEGNDSLINFEINVKVTPLLATGRYFPNLDHSLQPMCTFRNLCQLQKKLHTVTRNPRGTFYNDIN